MTIEDDLENELASWTADANTAAAAASAIMTAVIAVLRRRFPFVLYAELELLLADVRRDAEDLLNSLITGTINLDDAVDIVAERFMGGEP